MKLFLALGVVSVLLSTSANVEARPGMPKEKVWVKTDRLDNDLGTIIGWLRLLGGVKVSLYTGTASAKSFAEDEIRGRYAVSSGFIDNDGFRISVFGPPRRSGISIYPNLGFQAKSLSISGFEIDIPPVDPSGGFNIGANCRVAETGEEICDEPLKYDISLNSIFAGAGIAFNLVIGNTWMDVFTQPYFAMNLLEYQWINVETFTATQLSRNAEFAASLETGFRLGFTFPRWHFGVVGTFDFQRYFRFPYDEAVEFQGPVTYDKTKNVNLRPRVFVDAVSLNVFDWDVGVFVFF